MANARNPTMNPGDPLIYQIRIKGHLGPGFADWFPGLTMTLDANGETILTGPVVDQAALYGVLEISARCWSALALGRLCATRPGRWGRCQVNRIARIKANAEETYASTTRG